MGSLLFFPRYSTMEIQAINSAIDRALRELDSLQDYLNQFPVKQQRRMLNRIRETDSDSDYQPWGGLFRNPRFPQRIKDEEED
jgi:hypothetical protein